MSEDIVKMNLGLLGELYVLRYIQATTHGPGETELLKYSYVSTHYTGQGELKSLHCELHPVSDTWFSLGVQLQVPIKTLRCIRREKLPMSESPNA